MEGLVADRAIAVKPSCRPTANIAIASSSHGLYSVALCGKRKCVLYGITLGIAAGFQRFQAAKCAAIKRSLLLSW